MEALAGMNEKALETMNMRALALAVINERKRAMNERAWTLARVWEITLTTMDER